MRKTMESNANERKDILFLVRHWTASEGFRQELIERNYGPYNTDLPQIARCIANGWLTDEPSKASVLDKRADGTFDSIAVTDLGMEQFTRLTDKTNVIECRTHSEYIRKIIELSKNADDVYFWGMKDNISYGVNIDCGSQHYHVKLVDIEDCYVLRGVCENT